MLIRGIREEAHEDQRRKKGLGGEERIRRGLTVDKEDLGWDRSQKKEMRRIGEGKRNQRRDKKGIRRIGRGK